MATLNGKPITVETLIELGDIFDSAVANGIIQMTPEETELVNEGRLEAGRSTTHNILNGIGQDLGIVGEPGQSRSSNLIEAFTGQNPDEIGTGTGLQAAGGIGTIALALVPGGRALTGIKKLGNVANAIQKTIRLRKAGTGLKNSASFALAHKKAVAVTAIGGTVGGSVLSQALGDGGVSSAPPQMRGGRDEEGNFIPLDGEGKPLDGTNPVGAVTEMTGPNFDQPLDGADLAAEGDLDAFTAALANADDGGEGSGFLAGIGEVKVTRLLGPDGQELGGYLITLPDGSVETLFDDDLPAAVAEEKKAALDLQKTLREEARTNFEADRAFDQRNVEADRGLTRQRIQNEAIANLPTLLDTLTTPRGQLLADALAGRARGDLSIGGSQVSPQLRALFGLGPDEAIPLEGARRLTGTQSNGQGEEFTDQFEDAARLDPTRIPTGNFLANLSGADSDLLSALFSIGGEDPRDIAAQQRRLAAPGSGRGVSASVSR